MRTILFLVLFCSGLSAQTYSLIQADNDITREGISTVGFCLQADDPGFSELLGYQFFFTWDDPGVILVTVGDESPISPDWFSFDVINEAEDHGGELFGPRLGGVACIYDFMVSNFVVALNPQPAFSLQWSVPTSIETEFTVTFPDTLDLPGGVDEINLAVANPNGVTQSTDAPLNDQTRVFSYEILDGVPMLLGDVNIDDTVNIIDAIDMLGALFQGVPTACFAAGDVDVSGEVNLSDAIALLNHLFVQGVTFPEVSICEPREDIGLVQTGGDPDYACSPSSCVP